MAEKLFCNVDTILVDQGDHQVRFNRGDELVDVPAGTLDSMIRLGQAVTELPVEPPAEEPRKVIKPQPWTEARVDDLDLPKNVKKLLSAAGFSTVADVLAHGARFGSLLSLEGMTEAKEQAVQQSITKVKPPAKDGDKPPATGGE